MGTVACAFVRERDELALGEVVEGVQVTVWSGSWRRRQPRSAPRARLPVPPL
jgi:hypothetical protein